MDRDVALRACRCAPDVVFNALHGVPGEDGTVQGMMDLMGLTYTHSGLATSVIAIDKELTKQALVPHGIPMPGGRTCRKREPLQRDPLPRPYVLKPVNEGSSVGVAIVTADGNYRQPDRARCCGAVAGVRDVARRALYPGARADDAVLGDEALLVTELKPKSGFYDFDAKYTDGMTEHVCPAEIPDGDSRWPARTSRCARTGCSAARAPRAPTSAGMMKRASMACSAGGQHPAGHDALEPRARTGGEAGH
jgi:D-alanine-D-alanine ligase